MSARAACENGNGRKMRRTARLLSVSIVVVVEPRVTLLLFFRRQALLPDSPAVIAKAIQHPADILLSVLCVLIITLP